MSKIKKKLLKEDWVILANTTHPLVRLYIHVSLIHLLRKSTTVL